MNNKFANYTSLTGFLILFVMVGMFVACDDLVLPEEGSIPDETPPSASFGFTPNEEDYLTISFENLSNSATDYAWDFGNGGTSTDKNPTITYPGEGEYEVTLTASDKLGVSNTTSRMLDLVEPVISFTPVIENASFDIQGEDEYRDFWRNADLGGVIQISSSPVHSPEKAGKLPDDESRIGYQLITVLPETNYTLSFYYTLKTDKPGFLKVAMLGGHITNPADIEGATLASIELNDQDNSSTYVPGTLEFNSGAFSEVAIYFSNEGEEGRIDTFSIEQSQ